MIGMHWGTVVLSLNQLWSLQKDLKISKDFGYSKDDAIIFKIGELKKLKEIIN